MGLSGAREIMWLIDELAITRQNRQQKKAHDLAVAAILLIAKVLNQESVAAKFVLRQIAADPYTQFLQHIWDDKVASSASAGKIARLL